MNTTGGNELQFERAEYAARACSGCSAAIEAQYYAVNGKPICTNCHRALQVALAQGTPTHGFWRALGWGGAGALLGAVLYYAIRAATGYELGLVAIVVGIVVAKGVSRGAGPRGGVGYQILAVVLTYLAIVLTYVPLVVGQWSHHAPASGLALFITGVFLTGFTLIAPILVGFKAPLSLVITGIALYEAWKMSKRPPLTISGPYRAAAPAPRADVSG